MVNLMVANILYKLCLRMGFSIPSEEKMFLRQLRPYYVETKQKKVYFSVVKQIPTAELFFLQPFPPPGSIVYKSEDAFDH